VRLRYHREMQKGTDPPLCLLFLLGEQCCPAAAQQSPAGMASVDAARSAKGWRREEKEAKMDDTTSSGGTVWTSSPTAALLWLQEGSL